MESYIKTLEERLIVHSRIKKALTEVMKTWDKIEIRKAKMKLHNTAFRLRRDFPNINFDQIL